MLVMLLVAVAAGWSVVTVHNGQPASWLCDYDERPGRKHASPRVSKPLSTMLFLSSGFFFAQLKLWQQFAGSWLWLAVGVAVLWLGALIFLADWQFMIIPDQWVIALAFLGVLVYVLDWHWLPEMTLVEGGRRVFHHSLLSPVWGLCGGVVLLAINALGWLLTRTEVIGFGDVKLVLAIGLLCGPLVTLQILFAAFFISGSLFALLLLLGKLKVGEAKPLGPFLVSGLIGHLLFFEQCLDFSQWLFKF